MRESQQDDLSTAVVSTVRDVMTRPFSKRAKKAIGDGLLKMVDDPAEHAQDRERATRAAFSSWIRRGEHIASDQRQILDAELRDMTTGGLSAYPGVAGALGGAYYLVPTSFRDQVESAMKFAGPLQDLGTVIDTGHGRLYPMPSDSDTAVEGEFLAEDQAATQADVAGITQTILSSFRLSSKLVKVSVELLEDAGFDIAAYLAGRLGVRLGRALEPMLLSGTGSGQPTGVITASSQGTVAVGAVADDLASGANSIGLADIASLESAVDYSYRKQDAAWMCHPHTLQALRAQRDAKGAPLFASLQYTQSLLGYPLHVHPSMDQLQVGPSSPPIQRNVLAFGSFRHFVIRRATPVIFRLAERFAEYRQVAFLILWRIDSNLLDGGGGSVKYLSTLY